MNKRIVIFIGVLLFSSGVLLSQPWNYKNYPYSPEIPTVKVLQAPAQEKSWFEYPIVTFFAGAVVTIFLTIYNNKRADRIREEDLYIKNTEKLEDLKSLLIGALLQVDKIIERIYIFNFNTHYYYVMKEKDTNLVDAHGYHANFKHSEEAYNLNVTAYEDWKNEYFKPFQDIFQLTGKKNQDFTIAVSLLFQLELNPCKEFYINQFPLDYKTEKKRASELYNESYNKPIAHPILNHLMNASVPRKTKMNWLYFIKKIKQKKKLTKEEELLLLIKKK